MFALEFEACPYTTLNEGLRKSCRELVNGAKARAVGRYDDLWREGGECLAGLCDQGLRSIQMETANNSIDAPNAC
jgi:hypothetical protein